MSPALGRAKIAKTPSPGQRRTSRREHVMAKFRSSILTLIWAFVEFRRAVTCRLLDPYRPEQHYMRGTGPRSRAKQGLPRL
jgi:hypothetical protein